MRFSDGSVIPSGKRQLAPAITLGALGTVATIAQMALLSDLVGRVLVHHQRLSQLTPGLGLLAGASIVRAGLAWQEELSAQRAAIRLTSSLRQRVIARLLALGPAPLQHERSGDLATTVTEGVDRLMPCYRHYVPLQWLSLIVPALIILFLLPIDPLGAMLLVATAPMVPLLMVLIGKYSQVQVEQNWLALARLGAQFLDTIQGLPTLLLFGRGESAGIRIQAASSAFAERTLQVLRIAFLSGMVLDIMIGMAIGLVAVVVAIQLLAGSLPFPSALLVLLLTPECFRPLREMGTHRHAAMEGKAAGSRIAEILTMPVPDATIHLPTAGLPHGHHPTGEAVSAAPMAITFAGVTYRYRYNTGDCPEWCRRPAVAGLTFTLTPGRCTVLVGRSGAGKSTVIHLLLRFLDPDEGAITVNGVALRDVPPPLWRTHVALVPQHPHLFAGTVADNLRLARPDATQADLEWAVAQAGAAEFIGGLPGGFAAPVGEQGALLSAGQVQRLAIARAFLKDAPLLILDEPTSALDPESELRIRRSLQRLMAGRTVLIAAHRRNTIMAADQIIVLEHGRLVEIGGHRELLERGGAYAGLMGRTIGESATRCSNNLSDGLGMLTGPRLRSAAKLTPTAVGTYDPTQAAEGDPRFDRSRRSSLAADRSRSPVPPPSRLLLRLFSLLLPHLSLVVLSLLLGVLTGVAGIGLLATGGYLVAAAALGTPILSLGIPIALVRLFGVGRGIVRYAERLSAHRATLSLLTELHVWCYRRLLPLAPARLGAFRSGDLLTRLVRDIDDVQAMYLSVGAPIAVSLALGVMIVLLFAHFSLPLDLVMIAMLLLAGVGAPWLIFRLSRPEQQRIVAARAALQAQLVDALQGLADLLTSGDQHADPSGLRRGETLLSDPRHHLARLAALQRLIMTSLAGGTLLAVVLLSALLVDRGGLAAIDLPVLALVALVSVDAVRPLGEAFTALRRTTAAAERVYGLLDAVPAVADPPAPRAAPATFDVCFEHLTFGYGTGGPAALNDVSFRVPSGGRLAIVGPSGSGKTTVVNLLVRFWDPDLGSVRLGGHDVRAHRLDELRRSIGVVSQRTTLFHGTLRHNLLLARPQASDAQLLRALEQANLAGLVERSPLGLEQWIGEQGSQLSGGERQRLAIARTLLLDAPVLVLDEPTANLDPQTEWGLLAELTAVMAGRTTLYITHRLIGLEGMDEILVLDGGRIVERGTHAELAAQDGLYRRLLDVQNQFLDERQAVRGEE